MEINAIKTQADFDAAVARVGDLMDAEPGSPEADELEVLTLLVDEYQKKYYPVGLPDPIEAIKFCMEQQGLSRKDMVKYFGSPSKVSEVLNRKRPLSIAMIRALEKGLGLPAEVLIQETGQDFESGSSGTNDPDAAEMSAEYRFDYQKAKPNRFARQIVVVLDADVAKVFTSGEEVNQALRALISAMPKRATALDDGAGQGQDE